MKKSLQLLFFILGLSLLVPSVASAQMMNNANASVTGSPEQIKEQQQEQTEGKLFFDQLQSKQTTCDKLTDSDFEKIGEYIMDQQLGNTNSHIQMNDRIKQMMGDQGEERMHIAIAKSVTSCDKSTTVSSNTNNQQGGVSTMMGLSGYGYGNMMQGFGWGFGIFHLLLALVILIDLILLGVWLWKQINKK